jgi:UPF0042 nucleotide-binding protein
MTATIQIISFGYLHGEAPAADVTMDLRRHFRDPHVNPELRYMTALDAEVRTAVMNTPGIRQVLAGAVAMVEGYLAGPSADKHPVVIATGCAGGRHRAGSTAIALQAIFSGDTVTAAELGVEDLAAPYAARNLTVELDHRDLVKDVVDR